jgi:hypothetical protein
MNTPRPRDSVLSSPFTNPFDNDGELPKVGTVNADGTVFGGGPRDINCSACAKAGLPLEYGHGHRKGQRQFCPVGQRLSIKQAEEKQLDPLLKKLADDTVPTEKLTKPKHIESLSESQRLLEGMAADEILMFLAEGRVSAQHAKLAMIRSMKLASTEEKAYLQSCLDNVDTLVPKETKDKPTFLPAALKTAGKLTKLWASVVSYVKTDLHKTTKPETHQTPRMNMLTGELTVEAKQDEPVTSVAMMFLTIEHFRHIVRTRDYLTEHECHALTKWVGNQLSLGKPLLIVERTLKKLLQLLDCDMSLDLANIIDTQSMGMLSHEVDIAASSGIFREKETKEKEKIKKQGNRHPQDDDVVIALHVPNDSSCWYWSNSLNCPNKQKVNGVCKYANKHVCGMPLSSGGYCTEKHRAADHV